MRRKRAKSLPGPLVECPIRRSERRLKLPVSIAAKINQLFDGKRGDPTTLIDLEAGWCFAPGLHDKHVFGGYVTSRSKVTLAPDGLRQRKPNAQEIYDAINGKVMPCLCASCVRRIREWPTEQYIARKLQAWEWGDKGAMSPGTLALVRLHRERVELLATIAEANEIDLNADAYERVEAVLKRAVNQQEGT